MLVEEPKYQLASDWSWMPKDKSAAQEEKRASVVYSQEVIQTSQDDESASQNKSTVQQVARKLDGEIVFNATYTIDNQGLRHILTLNDTEEKKCISLQPVVHSFLVMDCLIAKPYLLKFKVGFLKHKSLT